MKTIKQSYAHTFAAMLIHCPKCDSDEIMLVFLVSSNKAFRNASTVCHCENCNSFFQTEKKLENSYHTIVEEIELINAS